MEYVVELESTDGILVDCYSDILYASFVFNGKRFTQLYPHGTSNEEIKRDAKLAIKNQSTPIEVDMINPQSTGE